MWPKIYVETYSSSNAAACDPEETFSSPQAAILSVSTKNNDLLLVPNQEFRESWTSGSSAQSQKFETIGHF